jgi:hypothetical protein
VVQIILDNMSTVVLPSGRKIETEDAMAHDNICKTCGREIPRKYFDRQLPDGRVIPIPIHKEICEFCPPAKHRELTSWANRLCNLYPERVIVLRRCFCNAKKISHHPSYDKPFEIMRICYKCHREEHRIERIKRSRALIPLAVNE